jgi:hypothetical protein
MLFPWVRLLLKFDDDSMYDHVSTGFFTARNNTDTEVLDNGLGYIMKQDQYLLGNNLTLSLDSTMMMGFWLYPVNPGMVLNPLSGAVSAVEMPIITMTRGDDENDEYFKVYESTMQNDNNFLTVSISDEYFVSSEPYASSMWHYIWLVYNGSGSDVKMDIYIDGKLQNTINESGAIPSSLNASIVDVYINRHTNGYAYNKTNNYGYIDDVVIFNIEQEAEETLQTIINNSVDYAVDDNFANMYEKNIGILYEDPATVRINSVVDDMSFIYAARSDGKILRGSPLFWQSRKIFSDEREKDLLNEVIVGDGVEGIEMVDGFLEVKNSIVRL